MTTTLIRRAGALTLVAATAVTLTGCGGVLGARMTYNDVEPTKITEIRISGGSGDVAVSTGTATQTKITRVVRRNTNPGESYRLDGTVLHLNTSCGHDCSVSYQIEAPAGVAVKGELRSGDILLDGVGATDVKLSSGDLTVQGATGPVVLQASSGDLRVIDAKGTVKAKASSGSIETINPGAAVDLEVSSGEITVLLNTPQSVTAEASSGDVNVMVPDGAYKITAQATSGDATVNGLTSDPGAKNIIDVRARSGDAVVSLAE
jgi:DUF4097 and DUF4098 domain-containing protein YvlB